MVEDKDIVVFTEDKIAVIGYVAIEARFGGARFRGRCIGVTPGVIECFQGVEVDFLKEVPPNHRLRTSRNY